MDAKEMKKQEADFKRMLRCKGAREEKERLKHVRLERQYLKRKYEPVMGMSLDDIPPHQFPKDNILIGFRRW